MCITAHAILSGFIIFKHFTFGNPPVPDLQRSSLLLLKHVIILRSLVTIMATLKGQESSCITGEKEREEKKTLQRQIQSNGTASLPLQYITGYIPTLTDQEVAASLCTISLFNAIYRVFFFKSLDFL